MSSLVDKIAAVHLDLTTADIPHAFGGALALAWCTQRARATIDIDINIFVDHSQAEPALAALPAAIELNPRSRNEIDTLGQTRLWWATTPIDVFFNTTDFHIAAAHRTRFEHFAGHEVPFLSCRDLAVFKAFFDRTKDWADLEEMAAAGTLDIDAVLGVLVNYLGVEDHRVARVRALSHR